MAYSFEERACLEGLAKLLKKFEEIIDRDIEKIEQFLFLSKGNF